MVKTNQKVAKCLNVEVDHIYIYDSNDFAKSDQFIIITLDHFARPSLKIAKHLVEWIALDVS